MDLIAKFFALAAISASMSAQATLLVSNGSNHSFDSAQSLNDAFSIEFNSEITQSTSAPHASVSGSGQNAFDFYRFTLTAPSFGIFDIDYGMDDVDSWLNLYDAAGRLLAQQDDAPVDAGSTHRYDSYLTYYFAAAGDYVISVGRYPDRPLDFGQDYILHVSTTPTIPEPETYAMLCTGLIAVALARRRKV